jgi:hypothetical protein
VRSLPVIRCLYLAATLFAVGCSPAARIADASGVIRANAESSLDRFARVETYGAAAGDRRIVTEAQGGAGEQRAIIGATEAIVQALPGVKDVVPWWATMLTYGAVALAIVGIVALLWMTGIGQFLRTLLAGVTGLVPRRQMRDADLAAKVMDEASAEGIREYIAARRAADPVFDIAYRKAQDERKRQSQGSQGTNPA